MKLDRVFQMAAYDLNREKTFLYYKISNGQWMFCNHDFAKLNNIKGYSSLEVIESHYFELQKSPTNPCQKYKQV